MAGPGSADCLGSAAGSQSASAPNSVIVAFWVASISLFIYGVFYPGLINFDTAEMLNQAVAGYCRDWHSPAIVLLWRGVNRILPGPAGLLGVGLLAFCPGALYFAQLSTGRLIPCLAIVAILCLWPPLLDDLVLVGKDQLFLACLMLFIALLIATLRKGRLDGWSLSWLAPLLFAAAAIRQDSAAILVPGLALLYRLPRGRSPGAGWGWKRAGAAALASVLAASFAVKQFNHFVAHAEHDFPIQTTLVHDLGGISAQTGHTLIPSYADPGFDLAEITGRYTPRNGDPLLFDAGRPSLRLTYDRRQEEELKALWIKSVLRYPRAYLQHRLASFAYLIGIRAPLPYQLYQLDTDLTMHKAYPRLAEINLGNPANAAVAYYRAEIVPALEDTPVFRGYAYDLLIVLGMALALRRRRALRDRVILALGGGALLHQSLLIFASPAALFRYLYPSVLVCLVILVLSLTRVSASDR